MWGVCRRLLNNEQDTEDAFQAAFLVLLRKAESLRAPQSLAAFLHGVAYRIAKKARVTAQRRRCHETQAETRTAGDPMAAVEQRELRVLDEELANLPEKYRAPLVLCYLEGKSNIETARQLGWRDGTVCGLLEVSHDGQVQMDIDLRADVDEPWHSAALVRRGEILKTAGVERMLSFGRSVCRQSVPASSVSPAIPAEDWRRR